MFRPVATPREKPGCPHDAGWDPAASYPAQQSRRGATLDQANLSELVVPGTVADVIRQRKWHRLPTGLSRGAGTGFHCQVSSLSRALGHHVEGLPDGLDGLITFNVSVKVDVLGKKKKVAAATV